MMNVTPVFSFRISISKIAVVSFCSFKNRPRPRKGSLSLHSLVFRYPKKLTLVPDNPRTMQEPGGDVDGFAWGQFDVGERRRFIIASSCWLRADAESPARSDPDALVSLLVVGVVLHGVARGEVEDFCERVAVVFV